MRFFESQLLKTTGIETIMSLPFNLQISPWEVESADDYNWPYQRFDMEVGGGGTLTVPYQKNQVELRLKNNEPIFTAGTDLSGNNPVVTIGGTTGAFTNTNLKVNGSINASAGIVGLENVSNTSDVNKPISTLQQTALNEKASTAFVQTALNEKASIVSLNEKASTAFVQNAIDGLVGGAASLATLVAGKAPSENPVFTGTVSGINAGMVGLDGVDNTPDRSKPISIAVEAALEWKAPLSSPNFFGHVTVNGNTVVGLSEADLAKLVSMLGAYTIPV